MCELAKRLAAHQRFEWRIGMYGFEMYGSWPNGFRVIDSETVPLTVGDAGRLIHGWNKADVYAVIDYTSLFYPDLDDAATQGLLWAMLVEACEGHDLSVSPELSEGEVLLHWPFGQKDRRSTFKADIDGEALAQALLEVWDEGRKRNIWLRWYRTLVETEPALALQKLRLRLLRFQPRGPAHGVGVVRTTVDGAGVTSRAQKSADD